MFWLVLVDRLICFLNHMEYLKCINWFKKKEKQIFDFILILLYFLGMSNANLHFHLFTKAEIFLKNSACRYISLSGQQKRNSKALIHSFL